MVHIGKDTQNLRPACTELYNCNDNPKIISIQNIIIFPALNESRICLIPEMLNCSSPALGKWLNLKLENISASNNKGDKKRFEVLQSNRGICTCNIDIGRIGKGSCHDHNF